MPSRYFFCAPVLVIVLSAAAFASHGLSDSAASPSEAGRAAPSAAAPETSFINSSLFKSGNFQSSPKSSTAGSEASYPGVELFIGYSHVRFGVPGNTPAQSSFDFQGGAVSLAYNLNRWLGLVGEAGIYKISSLPSATSATYLFGPRFSHRIDRFTLYVNALFGSARLSSDFSGTPSNTFFGAGSIHEQTFAAALGGGLDVRLNRHLSWRVVQGDYLLTTFNAGNISRQNNIRAGTGLVFRFGERRPPNHPPSVAVTATPAEVVSGSGEYALIRADARDPDDDPLTYTWSANAGKIEGTGAEVRWNPSGAAPGVYVINSRVDDGRGGVASSSTRVRVKPPPNRPPRMTCAASPQTVVAGQPVTITAQGSDPDNDQLTITFAVEGKKLPATNSSTTFETAGLVPGDYTINCQADDGHGGFAAANVDIEIEAPKQKLLESRLSLHSIYFPTGMPMEEDASSGLLPSQQQTLVTLAHDFKQYLSLRPEAHLILEGHADPRGGPEYNKVLSQRRVKQTKQFLVERGVSADAIETEALGIEQPMSIGQVKKTVQKDADLTRAQKTWLMRRLRGLALAQSRRVDVTLSTTGETSARQFPFNAEDALNLIRRRRIAHAKSARRRSASRKHGVPNQP